MSKPTQQNQMQHVDDLVAAARNKELDRQRNFVRMCPKEELPTNLLQDYMDLHAEIGHALITYLEERERFKQAEKKYIQQLIQQYHEEYKVWEAAYNKLKSK